MNDEIYFMDRKEIGVFDFYDRIIKRGRGYELDESLVSYYKTLWEGYDDWVESHYKASEVLTINIDEYDYVNNADDAEKVLEMIELKLKEIRAE